MPAPRLLAQSRVFVASLALAIVGVLALGITSALTQPAAATGNGTSAANNAPAAKGSPGQRLLNWSGITWLVYPNCGHCGPSLSPTTNASRAVYVDKRGWLHLKISKIAGKWRGVELRALTDVPYGTYRWVVNTDTSDLDPWAVLGMFVYRPHSPKFTNEIDIEDARFPHYLKPPNNAQFVVQPYATRGNEYPYSVQSTYHPLFQQFTWMPGYPPGTNGIVHFESRVGTTSRSPVLSRWAFQGYNVPTSQGMQLFVVLWMNKNMDPTSGSLTAVIRNLTITPLGG